MCTPARIAVCLSGVLVGCALMLGVVGGQDRPEGGKPKKEKKEKRDKGDRGDPESKAIYKSAEKAVRVPETERDRWLKELNKVFPGGVSPGLSDADFQQWFALLAGDAPSWRRGEPHKSFRDLFDRAAERLNLGRVEEIGRAEFLDYARGSLLPWNSPPWKAPADPLAGADKAFRSLDRDGSGFLEPPEWTDRLRAVAPRTDHDRDGRVSSEEYRVYFHGRVIETLETRPDAGPAPLPPPLRPPSEGDRRPVAIRYGRLPAGLPPWFEQLDTDRDGQVGLYEWLAADRQMREFREMDRDGDWLLTPADYLRYVRLREAEADAGDDPPPAPDPASRTTGSGGATPSQKSGGKGKY